MPIVKIVPMPGPQGPGGNGEGGDIADFVFDNPNNDSRITVANHDMIIRTTRSGTQDADINLESADDIFITANGDDIVLRAKDEVRISSNDDNDVNAYEWTFGSDGRIMFPDGTVQSTAANGVIPPSGFLNWREGTTHLPDLNTNFGWDSDGIWFTNASDNEGSRTSYPIFTDFTVAQNEPVIVRFDVAINDECSDIGVCVYVDGDTPEWNYGTNETRIAAQFDCLDLALYGRTTQTVPENTPVPDPGIYTVTFTYNPTVPTNKVVASYTAQNSNEVIASISLNEALPAGAYRVGFASDQNSSTIKTYMSNLTIDVNNDTDFYVSNLQIGNSLLSSDTGTTGDITFDGVQIIGAGTASGDGLGYGTIELVPDATLNSDQYLIIDPTGPNHIHIRAGGTQDSSTSELILGAERNKVAVSDLSKSVSITTAAIITNTYVNVNEVGNADLIVPDTSDILLGDNIVIAGISHPVTYFSPDPNNTGFSIVRATGVTFVAGASYTFVREEPYENYWSFGSDGVFSGPAMGGVKVPAITNAGPYNDLYIYVGGPDADLRLQSDQNINLYTEYGDILISADGGEYLGSASPENQIATMGDIAYTRVTVPASSIGQLSDVAGLVADDASYHYYCTGTYDGDTHIWKRIAWSNDTWPGV